jgi:hypothetical protein
VGERANTTIIIMGEQEGFASLNKDTLSDGIGSYAGSVVAFRTEAGYFGSKDEFFLVGGEQFGFITAPSDPNTSHQLIRFAVPEAGDSRTILVPFVLQCWDKENAAHIPCTFELRKATVEEKAGLRWAVTNGKAKTNYNHPLAQINWE